MFRLFYWQKLVCDVYQLYKFVSRMYVHLLLFRKPLYSGLRLGSHGCLSMLKLSVQKKKNISAETVAKN